MKKILLYLAISSVFLGCVENEASKRTVTTGTTSGSAPQGSNAESIPEFELSWSAVPESIDAYHIYYTSNGSNTAGVEINSLMAKGEAATAPKITIRAREVVLNSKKQACFYVVADSGGVMSPPSEAVCSPVTQ